jgi:chemotaxis protein histidine kinase CheA
VCKSAHIIFTNQEGEIRMKSSNPEITISALSAGVLIVIVGTISPVFSQQEKRGQDAERPKQEQQARPEQGQQQEIGKQDQQQQPAQQQRQEKGQQEQQQTQEKGQQQQQAKVRQVQQKQSTSMRNKKAGGQKQQPQTAGLKKQAADQQPREQAASPQTSKPQPKAAASQVKQPQQAAGLKKQQAQSSQPLQKVQPVQQSDRQGVWQQHRATSWQTEHRTWQQRGGYNGYRIPDDHFRGYFGSDHGFRINSVSLETYGGYPRFLYGGFWFGMLDPWPEYWSNDWYENDDVYIDYSGDGYYLYNHRYPNDRIAVTVYMN